MARRTESFDYTEAARAELAKIAFEETADGEIVATASDGVRVSLGNILVAPKQLVLYLAAHPTPDTW